MPLTLAFVFRIGLSFPGVEESTSFGAPALKVNGQMMACVPTHKAAEPNSLLIRVDRRDRPALLAESADLYYCPDYHRDYDSVLVRLSRLTPEIARDLLTMAHRFVTRTLSGRPRQSPANR